MIVDFHTHIFPPAVVADRAGYVDRDPTFAALYRSSDAKLASAEDLLRSMDRSNVDLSVIQGFAWSDLDDCRRHNDYLLEAARRSGGRLVPFCTVQPRTGQGALDELRRCASAGARGVGELRPENQGYGIVDSAEERLLVEAARTLDLVLLFHVSEPAGHPYPGKQGLRLEEFAAFAGSHPDVALVGAHWAGGLPFYGLMPEIRDRLRSLWFDTAASSLLYSDDIYRRVTSIVGADSILFGSDYPLLSQQRALTRAQTSGLSREDAEKVFGGNAARLLRLE